MVEKPDTVRRTGAKILAGGKQFIVTHSAEELDELIKGSSKFIQLRLLGGTTITVRVESIEVYGYWRNDGKEAR